MANHHHGTSYPPPLFVAELEAPSAGPPLAHAMNGAPVFEMCGDSAVVTDNDAQKRPLQHPVAASGAPVQANPWPFYLEDANKSQHSRVADSKDGKPGGVQGPRTEAEPGQANPWPYHGPSGDDNGNEMSTGRGDKEASSPNGNDQSRSHRGHNTDANAERTSSLAAQQLPPIDDRPLVSTSNPAVMNAERPNSTSPTQLYPAPLKVSRVSQPPSPRFKPYVPATIEQELPPAAHVAAPSPSSPHTGNPVTIPYRPYRPPSAVPSENSPVTTSDYNLDARPPAPYPTGSPPRHAYAPQRPPLPQSPPLPATSAARRSTQPSPMISGHPTLHSDAQVQRHHSFSTSSLDESPQSPFTDPSLASPLTTSPTGSSHRPSVSSIASQQNQYGPPKPSYYPLPSSNAQSVHPQSSYTGHTQPPYNTFPSPVASAPPPVQPFQAPRISTPQTPVDAVASRRNSSQSGQTQLSPRLSHEQYGSQPASRPAHHQQAQDVILPQLPRPHHQHMHTDQRLPPQQYPRHQQVPHQAPPPAQPPRPQIQHVATDPTSPTYLHPQSPPPPYAYDIHRTNSQPATVTHASSYQPPLQPPLPHGVYSPTPQSLHYGQAPQGPPQIYYPQQPYSPCHQLPPLPPRPVSAYAPSAPTGFGSGVPSTANFPPPPKTQYIPPPPQSGQRPSTVKLFSGSSAKKWLDKTNQVLESKLAPMLQAQTDVRLRPGQGQIQGQGQPHPQQQAYHAPPPAQHYYPYGIRGDPSISGHHTSTRGSNGGGY